MAAAAGTRNLGIKLLGVWLIVAAIAPYLGGPYGLGLLMSLLALAAGLLILIGR
jgi:hypothetical protein